MNAAEINLALDAIKTLLHLAVKAKGIASQTGELSASEEAALDARIKGFGSDPAWEKQPDPS